MWKVEALPPRLGWIRRLSIIKALSPSLFLPVPFHLYPTPRRGEQKQEPKEIHRRQTSVARGTNADLEARLSDPSPRTVPQKPLGFFGYSRALTRWAAPMGGIVGVDEGPDQRLFLLKVRLLGRFNIKSCFLDLPYTIPFLPNILSFEGPSPRNIPSGHKRTMTSPTPSISAQIAPNKSP